MRTLRASGNVGVALGQRREWQLAGDVGGYQVERPKKLPSKMCLTLNVGRRERSSKWGSALQAAPAWGSASRRTERGKSASPSSSLLLLLLVLPMRFVLCAPTFWAAGDALGEHVFQETELGQQ